MYNSLDMHCLYKLLNQRTTYSAGKYCGHNSYISTLLLVSPELFIAQSEHIQRWIGNFVLEKFIHI